jgi:hypothetical protein
LDVKYSETVDNSNTFDEIKISLPPILEDKDHREWNERDQVHDKVTLQIPLCYLFEIPSRGCLAVLGKFTQEFEAH